MRNPIAAGTFYPSDISELKKMLSSLFSKTSSMKPRADKDVLGVIVPHAGYVYSGYVAARSYNEISKKRGSTFVIIGPNHSGLGVSVSVYPKGYWITPLGKVKVDENVAKYIVDKSRYAMFDELAHLYEHSIEVQLPFLQYLFNNEFSIVPICLMDQSEEIAKDLAKTLYSINKDIVIIASSDFTHYEPKQAAEKKDKLLIDAIKILEIEKFYSVLRIHNISACGYGAIATLMEYTKLKGGKIIFLEYKTSGDFTGDYSNVVGYASLVSVK